MQRILATWGQQNKLIKGFLRGDDIWKRKNKKTAGWKKLKDILFEEPGLQE